MAKIGINFILVIDMMISGSTNAVKLALSTKHDLLLGNYTIRLDSGNCNEDYWAEKCCATCTKYKTGPAVGEFHNLVSIREKKKTNSYFLYCH